MPPVVFFANAINTSSSLLLNVGEIVTHAQMCVVVNGTSSSSDMWLCSDPRTLKEARRRRAEWRLACMRAKAILKRHLTSKQRQELAKYDFFHVRVKGPSFFDPTGPPEERIYRIRWGLIRNVDLISVRKGMLVPVRTYCAHPEGEDLPTADVMLGQKLMLESCEAVFLDVANSMDVTEDAKKAPEMTYRSLLSDEEVRLRRKELCALERISPNEEAEEGDTTMQLLA